MTWARGKVTAVRAALQRAAVGVGIAGATALVAPARLPAQATPQAAPVEQLFPARPTGYVTDVANVIDPAAAARMDDLITRLRAATGAEIAVVTLPTIGDREAAEVALAIGRRWGVGAKAEVGDPRRNAGVVVLLVPRQDGVEGSGQLRIEVGQGLEGIVPDATANQIYRRVMVPALARGAYSEGVLTGVQALVSTIARGYGVSDSTLTAYRPPSGGNGGAPSLPSMLPILLFVLFFIISSAGRRRRRRPGIYWGGPWIGGGWGGGGGFGGGGGGFGGFGGGGGFSGGGSGGRF